MNAGLGNRDAYRAADSVSQDGGPVLQCPLCFQGSNNEFHMLMKCNIMIPARSEIKLRDGRSLESTLIDLQSRSRDEFEAARMFLGQDKELQRTDMIDRGLALDILVDKFYLEWSTIRGLVVPRTAATH